MIKKITIAIILTVCILAFPMRLLHLSPEIELTVKIFKDAIFISIIFLLMRKNGFFRKEITFRKITLPVLLRLLPVLLLAAGYLVYAGAKNVQGFSMDADLLALTLLATLLAAAGEEVVIRGYVLNILLKVRYSVTKSLIVSSVIFSLLHFVNIFRYADVWSIFTQLIFAFALGMLFGSIYLFTRNLLFVSILHFSVNVPSVFSSLREPTASDLAILDSGLADNVVSLLIMAVLMMPFLMLSFYYIGLVQKRNGFASKNEDQLSVAE